MDRGSVQFSLRFHGLNLETLFSTKELDRLFLGYSDGFDLAHGLAPNQSCVNNPGTDDLIP